METNELLGIKQEICQYWSERSSAFGTIKREELSCDIADRWLRELKRYIDDEPCRILDIGTGSGFFAILMALQGHDVQGIDLTPSMIEEARLSSLQFHVPASFQGMDAEQLMFADRQFDVVLSRNLTWTLPHPEQAYREWLRVLKPGGLLLNFDANYARDERQCERNLEANHVHWQVTPSMLDKCQQIQKELEISQYDRPSWDVQLLSGLGLINVQTDCHVSDRVYYVKDEYYNPTPMFAIYGHKSKVK